jgi:AcrR family transcriptional regulator
MRKKAASKPARPRAAYHHGDLRRSLMDAALDLVAKQGVQGFTLREAARAAGVSHNAPYRHFASRTQLLIELALQGQALLLEALQTAARRQTDARERVVRMGMAYMEFALQHPALFRVLFSGEVARHRTPALKSAQAATFRYFEDQLRHGEEAGLIRPDAVPEHALVGWSALHGAAMLVLDGLLDDTAIAAGRTPSAIARLVIESLLTGMTAPPARARRR